jgi:hypothetical protein
VRLNGKVLLTWDDKGCRGLYQSSSRGTFHVNATGWSRGLEVAGGGTGIVSHAGLVLLRQLSDRTGLTSGLSAALPSPLGGHDRGLTSYAVAEARSKASGLAAGLSRRGPIGYSDKAVPVPATLKAP